MAQRRPGSRAVWVGCEAGRDRGAMVAVAKLFWAFRSVVSEEGTTDVYTLSSSFFLSFAVSVSLSLWCEDFYRLI